MTKVPPMKTKTPVLRGLAAAACFALMLPMAMPSYIVAYVYTDLLDYSGPLQAGLRALFGWQGPADYWFPAIRSLGGAAWVLALACLLAPGTASALGFGRLSVQSSQGQPLKAQIQVTSLSLAELASLRLRVASPQVHQTAGLVFDDVLSSLQVELVRQPDGGYVVQLSSGRPVTNVYVDLILEARWASGQRLMGYTLLVSPEGTPPPPVAQVSPVLGSPAPAAVSGGPATAAASEHAVKYGETLSELAQEYRPEGVSLDQMLVALYQANPQAFMGENMNRLKRSYFSKSPGTTTRAGQIFFARAVGIAVWMPSLRAS